jgi:hypothetical protein
VTEDDPTPEELKEAAALAAALEDGSESRPEGEPSENAPEEVLQAAALLRYAHDSELDPELEISLGNDLASLPATPVSERTAEKTAAETAGDIRPPSSVGSRPWLVVAPTVAILAAAAAVAIFWRSPGSELPPPPLALIRAQSGVIGAPAETLVELQVQNRRYRERWLLSMRDRYEGAP